MTWKPGDLVVWLAVLLPVTTRIPLATSDVGRAYVQTPMILLMTGVLGTMAVWVAQRDKWLGAFLVWAVLHALWQPRQAVFEWLAMVTAGVLVLTVLWDLEAATWRTVRVALVTMGVIQTIWMAVQVAGWDVTSTGLWPYHDLAQSGQVPIEPAGTLGNSRYLAAYLAMLLPLAPVWVLPVLGFGLYLTHSVLGIVAGLIGLLVRWKTKKALIAVTVIPVIVLTVHQHVGFVFSASARWEVWTQAVKALTALGWVLGVGPGLWIAFYTTLPLSTITQAEGFFVWAHNDWLQLVVDVGLVGLLGVLVWIWTRKIQWASPWGGALAAVGILMLGFSPWHLVTTGMVALVVLGGATTMKKEA